MPDQLKAGVTEQVLDISLIAGKKIVDAENIVIGRNQAIAKKDAIQGSRRRRLPGRFVSQTF
jgi:hypothetical protein